MRLRNFLNETIMMEVIKKDCKPFFKEFIDKGLIVYRGFNPLKSPSTFKRIKPRKERSPKDTPLALHNKLDDLFLKYHGWRARSQGVFCTMNEASTVYYGRKNLFFPIGNYKYLWHKEIRDLYFATSYDLIYINIDGLGEQELRFIMSNSLYNCSEFSVIFYYDLNRKHGNIEFKIKNNEISKIPEYEIKDYIKDKVLEKMVKSYKNTGIKKTISEIVFKCDEYYLVNTEFKNEI